MENNQPSVAFGGICICETIASLYELGRFWGGDIAKYSRL